MFLCVPIWPGQSLFMTEKSLGKAVALPSLPLITPLQFNQISINIKPILAKYGVGIYRTSRPVRKSGKFSKSGMSGNRTFSFPDAGLLTLLKVEEKIQTKKNFNVFFFKNFLQDFCCLFSNTSQFIFFYIKFVSRDLII
jgi:hypothetical protein